MSRAHGGPEQLRADGGLRLSPDAGDRSALRRAILLQEGRVERDGPGGEVVAHYLQDGRRKRLQQGWAPISRRLRRRPRPASLGPCRGRRRGRRQRRRRSAAGRNRDRLRRPDGRRAAVFPKIKLYDQRGDVAFNAWTRATRWQEPSPPGEYVSTAWIPGNLLNEGLATVDVGVMSLARAQAASSRRPQGGGLVPRPRPGRGRFCARALHRPSGRASCGRCSSGRRRNAPSVATRSRAKRVLQRRARRASP